MLGQKGLSLGAWIEIYEKKTNDKVDFPEGYRLLYMAERGFAIIKPDIEGKMMIVYEVCGDARFWRDVCELIGLSMGLECAGTICTRHIKPYIRSFGWEILREECIDGNYRYFCQDSIGRAVIITQRDINQDTGEPTFWVVSYFNKKAVTSLDDFDNISPF